MALRLPYATDACHIGGKWKTPANLSAVLSVLPPHCKDACNRERTYPISRRLSGGNRACLNLRSASSRSSRGTLSGWYLSAARLYAWPLTWCRV